MQLFRRRQVWVPTVWAWLALAVLGGGAALLAIRNLYGFLSPTQPVGAPVLVVEGWLPDRELDLAIAVYQRGQYARVVTTGGPIERGCERREASSYAERARNALVQAGVPADLVTAVPAPASAQDRSFLNAVMLRDWAAGAGVSLDAFDLVSSGVHSRRSRLVYALALGGRTRVGIVAVTPSEYDPDHWWRTSTGAKEVLGEAIAWLWTECCFWPGPPGSVREKWGVPG
jgi:DUF218 domain-containing protein